MNCLLVPTLALDISLLDRLADSIDYPIGHKVVINNGPAGALKGWRARHPDWLVLGVGENLGVAASWNMAPKMWPDEDAYLIVNDDIQFHPGALKMICEASDQEAKNHPLLMLNPTDPFYCFVWTKRGVEEFGLFDENYFPAYWEDCDLRVRFNIAGVKHFYITDGCPINHGKPRVGGINYAAMIQGTGLINRDYFLRKWGSLDEKNPPFKTPFNDPKNSLKDWQMEKERYAAKLAIWKAFIGLGPTLYD